MGRWVGRRPPAAAAAAAAGGTLVPRAVRLQSAYRPRSGRCTIPPQINNRNKSNLLPFAGLVSRVTKYRNRRGQRSSRDEDRTALGAAAPCSLHRGQEAAGPADCGPQERLWAARHGRKYALVVFKSGIWVFCLKQTWKQNGLGYTQPAGNKIQESNTITSYMKIS